MDVSTFLRKTKAPEALAPHLLFLNDSDNFAPYLTDPEDWLAMGVNERILHGVRLLNNAWRYHTKRRPTFACDRDTVLESVFAVLCHAAGKLHDGIGNPGGYLFVAVRNAISKEIEKYNQLVSYLDKKGKTKLKPMRHAENFGNLLADGSGFRHNGKAVRSSLDWELANGPFNPDGWGSVLESYQLLESLCSNETERAILYERWRKPSEGWLSPEWASVIAERLELPLAYVLNTLQSIQTRYVASVNEIKRQRHERQIKPVPLSHISPDKPAIAQPIKSITAVA
jgi:hypothetical protein